MNCHLRFGLSRSEWDRLIEEWVFSAERRAIMREAMLDGLCHGEIAARHSLSVDRIRSIIREEKHTLFEQAEQIKRPT